MTPINILIVDDREENIIALEALLNRDDVRIYSSTSANEGLKLAWEHNISIALIDVQMPVMNGFELAEIMKSNPRTRDVMIIFVTAQSIETKYALKGFRKGAVDYLYKPLDPYITAAKVDSFIKLAVYQEDIKQKNKELQNYAVVVKNSADIICTIDIDNYHIKTINPAAEKILGYSPAALIGESIINFAVDSQKNNVRKELDNVVKECLNTAVFECQFFTSGKHQIWVECRATCQNRTIFINISDISQKKIVLNKAIKLKETAEYGKKIKETFLANMSHELRTPVNGIIGLTTLLRKTPLNEQQNSMIDLMEISSQSLLGVINDVLDISKMEAGKFTIIRSPNNLHDLLRAVYGLLKFKADENNIEFILEIAPGVPVYLLIDSLRLNQVLMNLLSNAIKFTERGYVKLSVSVLEKTAGKVKLKFMVEDSGIGIPQGRLLSIFDSFEQAEDDTATKYGGTGLGLTIVKKLVELKGGELAVSSDVGKGSTFSFINWYTESDKPKEKASFKTDRTLEPFGNVNILVAEDNLVNQFMLSKMLKDWDVAVEMVDNGIKVLDKMKLNNYDLILMDTHMPEMDGYQAAKAIRAEFSEPKRSTPIISLSAASFDFEQEEALLSGMNDVLSKPFQPNELHRKIRRLLKSSLVVKSPA